MTWNELKKKPHVAVYNRGSETEVIVIRDRCDTCKLFTRPGLCPERCGRVNEPAFDWCGRVFLKGHDEASAAEEYRNTYPEYCQQLQLF